MHGIFYFAWILLQDQDLSEDSDIETIEEAETEIKNENNNQDIVANDEAETKAIREKMLNFFAGLFGLTLILATLFTIYNFAGTLNVFFLIGTVYFALPALITLGLYIHDAVITILKNKRHQENNVST